MPARPTPRSSRPDGLLGVVAAGSAAAADAAAEVLRRGGTACDAAIAAGCAAAVAEPCLTSLAGGGFLLAHDADGSATLYDFFVNAPGLGGDVVGRHHDLVAVPVQFEHTVQEFHVGPASVAVPGVLAGYLHVHERRGRLPLADLVAPAIALAHRGVTVDPPLARLLRMLDPILSSTPEGADMFRRDGRPRGEGDTLRNPALADFLHDVGAGLRQRFRSDELGADVTEDDLRAYRVAERDPLEVRFRGQLLLTNPAPSFGGALVAHGLERLGAEPRRSGPAQVERLAEALVAMAEHRRTLGPGSSRGTTHVSVVDADGNAAAMTTSNGSGSGLFAPGTGVQLNNVMGEEDLHPAGFGSLLPGERVGSMMSPSVLLGPHDTTVALGSGGSERIRSAITQVVVGLVDDRRALADAVHHPRMHWDGAVLQVEPGLPGDALAALRARWPVNEWTAPDLYFGGVHAAAGPDVAVGDPRRGGVGRVVR